MSFPKSAFPVNGYIQGNLRETEEVPYEGTYHRPATLVIEFVWHENVPLIMGARLYNNAKRYIGWWPSFNVPRSVLTEWACRIEEKELVSRLVFGKMGDGGDTLEHL